MAAVEGNDTDVFGYHLESDMLAVNVFHLRGGKIVDRREFFWEELPETQIREGTGAQGAEIAGIARNRRNQSCFELSCSPSDSGDSSAIPAISAITRRSR